MNYSLNATPSVGVGTWTYTGSGTATFTPNANTPNATVTVSAYGNYNFIWTELNGVCSDSDTSNVTFYAPILANAGRDTSICQGDIFVMPLGFATASNYSSLYWTSDGVGMLSNANTLTPNYTPIVGEIGTVTFTLHVDGNGPCPDLTDNLLLIINPIPTPSIIGDTFVCANENNTIFSTTNVSGNSYLWNVIGGIITAGQNTNQITITWASSGIGHITLTETVTSSICAVTTSQDVLINPTPNPIVTGLLAVCANQNNVTYSTPFVNGHSYSWSINNGVIITGQNSNQINVNWGNAANGWVRVNEIDTNTYCSTSSANLNILIRSLPTAVISGTDSICNDGVQYASLVFNLTGTGPWNFAYTNGSVNFNINGTFANPYIVNTRTPDTYTLISVSDRYCNGSVSGNAVIAMIPLPYANAGRNDTVCEGESYILHTNHAIASNYSSVIWTTSGWGILSNSNTLTPTYYPVPGESNVVLTLTANGIGPCRDSSDQMILYITPAPLVNAGNDTILCEGSVITLPNGHSTATNFRGISWSYVGNGTLASANTLTPTYSPASGDTNVLLILTAFGNNPCGIVIDTIVINYIPAPTSFAGNNDSTCQHQPYTFANANATNYNLVLWTTNGHGILTNQNTLSPTYTPINGETGIIQFMINVHGNAPCDIITDTMELLVKPLPIARIILANDTLCAVVGTQYSITSDTSSFGVISWTTTGDGAYNNSSILHPNYIVGYNDSLNGNVSLVLNVTNDCGIRSDTFVLYILHNPIAILNSNSPICEGDSLLLDVNLSTVLSNVTYSWTHNNSTWNSNLQDPNIPNAVPSNSGIYNVVVSNLPYNCPNVLGNISVIVHPRPNTSAIQNIDDTVCVSEIEYYNVNGFNNSAFHWTVSGGNIVPANTINDSIIVGWGNNSGNYEVTVVEVSEFGCIGDTITDPVYVEDPSLWTITGPDTVCSGTPVNITVTGGSNYIWMNGEISNTINAIPINTTNYSVVVYGCLTDTLLHTVNTWALPEPGFTYSPNYPIIDESVYFTYGGGTAIQFTWLINYTDPPFALNDSHPIHSFSDTGLYDVTLIVVDQHGCIDTSSQEVLVRQNTNLWVPNAFTPNGDALNQIFLPIGNFDPSRIERYEFYIFDRWGTQVFYTKDFNEGWDGNYNGGQAPMDTYTWLIILKVSERISFEPEKAYRGKVTLIR